MNASQFLLHRAMVVTGLTSHYKMAQALNVKAQTVYNWRDGTGQADELNAIKMAKLAKLDPAPYIAQMHAENARNPETRQFWHATAARLAA